MKNLLLKIKNNLQYLLVSLLIAPILFWWISSAQTDDLLWQIMIWTIGRDVVLDMWDTPNEVGEHVINSNWAEVSLWEGIRDTTTVIVKVTRLILSLVVAISVTMILYNWMSYIIQTWQWKEWKNLVSNVIYIVVGILICLFSVTIITIIQSIWPSIEEWTTAQTDNKEDNDLLKWKYVTPATYVTEKITQIING